MPKRQVFFSFEFKKDAWRAGQIRNMGKVDDSSTFSDNDWEKVRLRTDSEIKRWIDSEMEKRSCIVVLIGHTTSTRKWVKYEIQKAYELNKGIVGIYIHNIKNQNKYITSKGANPFYQLYTHDGHRLSEYVTDYDPVDNYKISAFEDIKEHIEDLIEEALENKAPQ